jgi:hypothetical protein
MDVELSHCVIMSRVHKSELDQSQAVMHNSLMNGESGRPFEEQGRRLRLLRQAQRIRTGTEFARLMNWPQSGYSQFETGARSLPAAKVLQLSRTIPGFSPLWLWEGDKRGLAFDLLQRIEAEEAKEAEQPGDQKSA